MAHSFFPPAKTENQILTNNLYQLPNEILHTVFSNLIGNKDFKSAWAAFRDTQPVIEDVIFCKDNFDNLSLQLAFFHALNESKTILRTEEHILSLAIKLFAQIANPKFNPEQKFKALNILCKTLDTSYNTNEVLASKSLDYCCFYAYRHQLLKLTCSIDLIWTNQIMERVLPYLLKDDIRELSQFCKDKKGLIPLIATKHQNAIFARLESALNTDSESKILVLEGLLSFIPIKKNQPLDRELLSIAINLINANNPSFKQIGLFSVVTAIIDLSNSSVLTPILQTFLPQMNDKNFPLINFLANISGFLNDETKRSIANKLHSFLKNANLTTCDEIFRFYACTPTILTEEIKTSLLEKIHSLLENEFEMLYDTNDDNEITYGIVAFVKSIAPILSEKQLSRLCAGLEILTLKTSYNNNLLIIFDSLSILSPYLQKQKQLELFETLKYFLPYYYTTKIIDAVANCLSVLAPIIPRNSLDNFINDCQKRLAHHEVEIQYAAIAGIAAVFPYIDSYKRDIVLRKLNRLFPLIDNKSCIKILKCIAIDFTLISEDNEMAIVKSLIKIMSDNVNSEDHLILNQLLSTLTFQLNHTDYINTIDYLLNQLTQVLDLNESSALLKILSQLLFSQDPVLLNKVESLTDATPQAVVLKAMSLRIQHIAHKLDHPTIEHCFKYSV